MPSSERNFCGRRAQITAKPLVAIGGITLERAAEVYRAGADSLAVIRDLICAPDPGARAREYLEVAGVRIAAICANRPGNGSGHVPDVTKRASCPKSSRR